MKHTTWSSKPPNVISIFIAFLFIYWPYRGKNCHICRWKINLMLLSNGFRTNQVFIERTMLWKWYINKYSREIKWYPFTKTTLDQKLWILIIDIKVFFVSTTIQSDILITNIFVHLHWKYVEHFCSFCIANVICKNLYIFDVDLYLHERRRTLSFWHSTRFLCLEMYPSNVFVMILLLSFVIITWQYISFIICFLALAKICSYLQMCWVKCLILYINKYIYIYIYTPVNI
jgi:hypothetical protein